jgi:hypothetical protein
VLTDESGEERVLDLGQTWDYQKGDWYLVMNLP